ncbi:MAG: UDP-N-acetylmuramate dehydrogenase [Bacteroidales bacterium]|jgi:UDP-N-acetylmuramate dehydrogenase|nr:UDP-N-acetylmuramate dehydrogenase [Bacteroidales bacterium]
MLEYRQNVSLLPYNTFGIDATAQTMIVADDADALAHELRTLRAPETKPLSDMLILGGGSNILFVSEKCPLVIHPVFKGIELLEEHNDTALVRACAGEIWDEWIQWCIERGYSGMENLSAIPGTVGACPVQNIGAYGTEAKDVIETVEAVETATGKTVHFRRRECGFGYRDSFFKQHKGKYLIVSVTFRLSKTFTPQLSYAGLQTELAGELEITPSSVRDAVMRIRQQKLPEWQQLGSAGSFFKNPLVSQQKVEELRRTYENIPLYSVPQDGFRKISAAWLIEQCGWKGVQKGHVGVYHNQPLILVNRGNATGREVMDFAREIMDSAEKKFGIRMETEVNIV